VTLHSCTDIASPKARDCYLQMGCSWWEVDVLSWRATALRSPWNPID